MSAAAQPAAGVAARLRGLPALAMFAALAGAYFLSYGLRSVNAIIAPELTHAFALRNAQLGALTSAYFVGFALLQLPLGIWLDRYGPRHTHALLLLVAAGGSAVFATAAGMPGLWLGRALVGVGVSGALMAAYKSYRLWLPEDRQAQLAMWMLTAGTLGVLASTVPVQQWALPAVGWRGVFWLAAALLLLAAIAVFVAVPSHRGGGAAQDRGGYRRVFADAHFRRCAVVAVTVQAGFMAWQSLWLGPWFGRVLGADAGTAAHWLLRLNLVLMAAYLMLGVLTRPLARRGWDTPRIVLVADAAALVVLGAIVVVTSPWAWVLWLLVAWLMAANGLIQTHVALTFPTAMAGRANTAYNFILFVAVFAQQWLIGVVIDAFEAVGFDPRAAFRLALATTIAVYAAALAVFAAWRPLPRRDNRATLVGVPRDGETGGGVD